MELVLGQQPSPSSSSGPETPSTHPPSVTSHSPAPRISTSTPEPPTPTPTPDPPTVHPEAPAPPTETAPAEPDIQDEDQVNPEPAVKCPIMREGELRASLCPGSVFKPESEFPE